MNDFFEKNDARASGQSEGEQDQTVFFRGVISRVTYRDEESGFGVLKAEPDSGSDDSVATTGGLTTLVGVFPATIAAGTCVVARGEWQRHPKFGRQFRARSVTEADPTGKEAIARYLASGAVKGFGPTLAGRVVEAFGDETLEVIDNEPHRLLEVSGIGQKKLDEILGSWQEKKNVREVLLFFQNHGISLNLSHRIYNYYGDRAIEVVSSNPYVLAREVWGIGFRTADRIASALGTDPESPERLIAGVLYSLEKSGDDGHCFLPREDLKEKAAKLLGVYEEALIDRAILEASLAGELIDEDGRIYSPDLYTAEQQLARSLAARANRDIRPSKSIDEQLVENACGKTIISQRATKESGGSPEVVRLSEQQKEAIRLAATRPLVVITGGPGCGKTTVLQTLAEVFRQAGLETKLAAPTGRAAQRMSEICGMPASTIHRLLKYDPIKRTFVHDQYDQLPLDALIIDESSMIDISLAAALLRAVPPSARIVIVGDADQLPSVGPGLFLSDVLTVESIPRVRLTTLFRRANESSITSIAHRINEGKIPSIPEPDGSIKTDAYFLPAKDPEDAASLIERLVVEQIPKKFGLSGSDITVLTPMNQGSLGVIALNQRLQQKLVPSLAGMASVKIGAIELRPGDRVCQRVNNYNLHRNGVFNGDQGTIIGVDPGNKSVFVELWDGREIEYPSETLHQLDLAYALTIHRSQGSEVPAVILAVHDSHTIMLERQLIYTGITRAKSLLIVVGTRKALAIATKRSRSRKRFTRLSERIYDLSEPRFDVEAY